MVRKRGRNSRKYYDSEEDNDSSELEFDLDESSQSAPKQYSLRQRKRPLFTDLDYDEDEDLPRKKNDSDDDFQVEDELPVNYAPATVYTAYNTENNYDKVPTASEELIDFEDIIRADIVVNKRKINDDISKTEVDVIQPTGTSEHPVVMPKRGRPRKYPINSDDVALSYFEPQIGVDVDEDKNDEDYDPIAALEEIHCTRREEKEYEIEKGCNEESNQQCSTEDPLSIANELSNGAAWENSPSDSDRPTKQVNGETTSFENLAPQIAKSAEQSSSWNSVIEDESDDDVVFIEDPSRSEIIVLDD